MRLGSLAVVEEWLDAVNRGDARRAGQLWADEVEIAGPRGSMRGRKVLAAWMGRAGFSAESLRWFCGADGSVVVEQAARWIDPATGADRGQAQVASYFCVEGGDIARYARYENLELALTAAGLDESDEVIPEQRWP
jgi:ketosteroid isomerase-like protein